MAIEKETHLTKEGLQKLSAELEYLNGKRSIEIAQKLEEARSHGDLSENSEYDEAKAEQAENAMKIEKLKATLKNVVIIDDSDLKTDTVKLGLKVTLHDEEFDEDIEYYLVGSTEANPLERKISNESPVGKAIMGHSKGETVSVATLDGTLKYKIVNIAKPKSK